jgi:hypothetical protein
MATVIGSVLGSDAFECLTMEVGPQTCRGGTCPQGRGRSACVASNHVTYEFNECFLWEGS